MRALCAALRSTADRSTWRSACGAGVILRTCASRLSFASSHSYSYTALHSLFLLRASLAHGMTAVKRRAHLLASRLASLHAAELSLPLVCSRRHSGVSHLALFSLCISAHSCACSPHRCAHHAGHNSGNVAKIKNDKPNNVVCNKKRGSVCNVSNDRTRGAL